jgi:hypothetical protein
VLTLSRIVDECKPLADGYAAIYPDTPLPIQDLKFTSINRIPTVGQCRLTLWNPS